MTKKHYTAIAKILKHNDNREDIIEQLCIYFTNNAPLFNANKFREASGYKRIRPDIDITQDTDIAQGQQVFKFKERR